MAEYVCSVCGYVYEEAKGIPGAGIAPGTKWEDLPNDWTCPLCGAAKADFDKKGAPAGEAVRPAPVKDAPADGQVFSPLEYAALCTNLARGCEKQYKPDEAGLFMELAAYFEGTAAKKADAGFEMLLSQIEEDIREGFPSANAAAAGNADRGALRALVWSEKVTRIQKSLLSRHMDEGDAMTQDKDVYVCTICGFVYIGNDLPDVCPICKVPNWKFEKIEGGQ